MEQLVFFDIPSPCVGICQSDDKGYCKGCMRSRDERFGWLNYSNAQKTEVIRLCRDRKRRRLQALQKQRQQQQLADVAAQNQQLDFEPPRSAPAAEPASDAVDLSDFSLE